MCAMLEYASIRFTFVCISATMLPPVIVSTARTAIAPYQSAPLAPRPSTKRRTSRAKAPSLGPTDRKPVMGVGAPW